MEDSGKKEEVVAVQNLGKTYRVWRDPSSRLKAPLMERARKLIPFGKRSDVSAASSEDDGSRIVNRNRYYYDFRALKGVDLTLRKGDSIGIIGRNGSGKSTLLQLIAGTLTPTEGRVQTRGRVAALLELGAGFNDEFTGRENVYMNGSILGLSKAEIDERFDRIAEFANIGEFMEQPIKTYSSGMRVRLAFAVQAEVDPDILIVDEALAVGDIRFTMKCIRRMRQLVEKGTTLIFVSHDLGSIVNFCKEVIWIHDGCVFRRGEPREVTLEYSNFMHYGELIQANNESKRLNYDNEGNAETTTDSDETSVVEDSFEESDSQDVDYEIKKAFRLPSKLKFEDISKLPKDGNGGLLMLKAAIYLPESERTSYTFNGGENLNFFLLVKALNDISKPILCADIYDLKGNLVFGINSCFTGGLDYGLKAHRYYVFRFSCSLPLLRIGDYVVLFGCSTGTYNDHTYVCGVPEALGFSIKNDLLSQRHHIVSIPGSISLLESR